MYLGYASLKIDTVARVLPTAWAGLNVRDKNDTLLVSNVEWLSPAWNSGLRRNATILQVDGKLVKAQAFNEILSKAKAGDKIKIRFKASTGIREEELIFTIKKESSYAISPVETPTPLQASILKSWLGE